MASKHLRQWLYYLLIIPYFKPALFDVMEETALLETIFDLWRLAAAVAICVLYLYQAIRFRRRPSSVLILLCVYLGFVAAATLLRQDNLWPLTNHVLTIVTFCMLLEVRLRQDPHGAVDMLVMPLTVLILLNFMLECVFPRGVTDGGTYGYSYNLMGIDNLLGPVLVPYMFLVALRSSIVHGRLNWFVYLMIFVASESLILVWSATGMMGMLVALIFLLFIYGRKGERLFNFLSASLTGALMHFGIVMFRLQNLFEFFITGVLHKGLSFTGRTDIWDRAMFLIDRAPFLGYGIAKPGKVYRLAKHKYYHAHNVFLELLVEGGLGALIAYLFMLERCGRQLMIYRKHSYACLISGGLLAVMVMTSMEPFLDHNGLLIYALIFLGHYVGSLIQGAYVPPLGTK